VFEPLINIAQCPAGKSVFIRHRGKELAVHHLLEPQERFVVSDNACPHASGNLAAGELHRSAIVCPVHHWKFDLDSGYCVGTYDVILRRYASRVDNDTLLVDIDQPLSVPPPPVRKF
jgi:nitrite reductase (NADH) small subunit